MEWNVRRGVPKEKSCLPALQQVLLPHAVRGGQEPAWQGSLLSREPGHTPAMLTELPLLPGLGGDQRPCFVHL